MKNLRFSIKMVQLLLIGSLFMCQGVGLQLVSASEEKELIFTMGDDLKIMGLVKKPKGDGPFPTVIFLHGSGGMTPDYEKWIEYLSENGFVGVIYARRAFPFGRGSPDEKHRYRDYIFKDISDLNCVIEKLKELSFIGSASLFVMGQSEGGITAYLAASQIKGLKGVIGLNGPTDFLDMYAWTLKEYPKYPMPRLASAAKNIRKFLGCTPEECRERYTIYSPIHHVEQISCPVMIVHGEKDLWVPIRQIQGFVKTLKDVDKPHEAHIYPKEGHLLYLFSLPDIGTTGQVSEWLKPQVWSWKNSQDVLNKIMTFLNKHGK